MQYWQGVVEYAAHRLQVAVGTNFIRVNSTEFHQESYKVQQQMGRRLAEFAQDLLRAEEGWYPADYTRHAHC